MISLQNVSVGNLIQGLPSNTVEITKRDGGYIVSCNSIVMHMYANQNENLFEKRLQVYLKKSNHIDTSTLEIILDFTIALANENKLKGICFIQPTDEVLKETLIRFGFQETADPLFIETINEMKLSNVNVVTDWIINL